MTYKEAYIELKARLEKAEYELRLMRQKQQGGSSEQKRLDAKISGLMISLEYIHEAESSLENSETWGEEKNIQEIRDYLENSYTGARMLDQEEAMLRIARAIFAFKADVNEEVFSDKVQEREMLREYS